MAALFPKIYDIITENPHKNSNLLPLLTRNESGRSNQWESFEVSALQPPGTTSFALWSTDPLYRSATPYLRRQLLRDSILEFEKRTDVELTGRQWPRKKIHEAFARELGTNPNPSEKLLEEACAELCGYQKIVLHREKKTISFWPEDIRCWRRSAPLLFSDSENHWILEPLGNVIWSLAKLGIWLGEKEQEGWTISWPVAEGKIEELRAELEKQGIGTLNTAGKKLLKEGLARKVGRTQALTTLARGDSEI